MKKPVYQVSNLTKNYGEGSGMTRALRGIKLNIYEGEMLCVVGGSGSGKTTLLNLLAGMDKASEGKILYCGKDVTHYSSRELTIFRRDEIGFVFQFFNLIDELTVYQNLTLTPGSNKNKDEVMNLLKTLDLDEKINDYPKELSGGQQQRVSIARALNKKYNILFCDEPTGALDYNSGKEILTLLEKIHAKSKKTIVIVTHTKEIAKMCDRVITLKSGQIVKEIINKHPVKASEVDW